MDKKVKIEPSTVDTTALAIIAAVIAIIITIYWLTKKSYKKNTILIVGLSDAGKSRIFTKLLNKNSDSITYTSFQENVVELDVKGDALRVVDFPGAERLRKQLTEKWLTKEGKSLKTIVFVVDSSTFSKKTRDVAEFLYDVLLYTNAKVPVTVACNKQDQGLAKSSQVVRVSLEKEMGLINKSRAAALVTTDGSANRKTLTNNGAEFTWEDLPCHLDFVECSAGEDSEVGVEAIKALLRN